MGSAMVTDVPGTYVLAMELPSPSNIEIGALGPICFRAGTYAYVGSAMKGLRRRIARHLCREKNMHWHIDYFLRDATVIQVWYTSEEQWECEVAARLAACFDTVEGFGCSDCRCASHLFCAPSEAELARQLASLGLISSAPEEWR